MGVTTQNYLISKLQGFFSLPMNWPQLRAKLSSFSHSDMSDSLRPHGLQHARLPCPSPSLGGAAAESPLGLRAQGSRQTKFWEAPPSRHLLSATVTQCWVAEEASQSCGFHVRHVPSAGHEISLVCRCCLWKWNRIKANWSVSESQ